MAQAIAGVCFLKLNGQQFPLRGSFKIQCNSLESEMVVGQDSVHGYIQKPVAPSIEGQISDYGNISFQALTLVTGSTTITAELRNGRIFVLNDAVFVGPADLDATEGSMTVKFQGSVCSEILA